LQIDLQPSPAQWAANAQFLTPRFDLPNTMPFFAQAHATHPNWRMALALVASQLETQRHDMGGLKGVYAPTLGWIYLTEAYAFEATLLLDELRQRWPGCAWVGAVGMGICATGTEYFDKPALAVMVCDLPANSFRVFSGVAPLVGFQATTAQVHADTSTADLPELLIEMAQRTESSYLFGGVSSGRGSSAGLAAVRSAHMANGVFNGGLSGVAFGAKVGLVSRVTQGCQPIGPTRRITAGEHNLVLSLDGEGALDVLLRDLSLDSLDLSQALPRFRQTLVGLSDGDGHGDALARPGQFGGNTRVRHLVGFDQARRGLAIGDQAIPGQHLAFCGRNREAAQRDLVRICTEIRDELEPDALAPATAAAHRMLGAIFVSCMGRGGAHFGAPHAEMAIIRRALGDIPLVGFFAAGEIARHQLYGYTGVLTVFTG
jgi:small ligand-binding sensory domain FIST